MRTICCLIDNYLKNTFFSVEKDLDYFSFLIHGVKRNSKKDIGIIVTDKKKLKEFIDFLLRKEGGFGLNVIVIQKF